jgi:hypothetical protein
MAPQPPGSGGLAEQVVALQRKLDELTRKAGGGGIAVFIQDEEPTDPKIGDLWTPATSPP